jgi:hypothetical protein
MLPQDNRNLNTCPSELVAFTVNPTGTVDSTGKAIISGTYKCTIAEVINIVLLTSQGANAGVGIDLDTLTCDGNMKNWSVTMIAVPNKFVPGDVKVRPVVTLIDISISWWLSLSLRVLPCDNKPEQTVTLLLV